MDDLDFIKKHVPQKVEEAKTFNTAEDMIESLMRDVIDAHVECEFEHGPEDEITLQLADIVRKYSGAKIKGR